MKRVFFKKYILWGLVALLILQSLFAIVFSYRYVFLNGDTQSNIRQISSSSTTQSSSFDTSILDTSDSYTERDSRDGLSWSSLIRLEGGKLILTINSILAQGFEKSYESNISTMVSDGETMVPYKEWVFDGDYYGGDNLINGIITNIRVEKQGYVFEGIYSSANGAGIQYYDKNVNPTQNAYDKNKDEGANNNGILTDSRMYVYWRRPIQTIQLDLQYDNQSSFSIDVRYEEPVPNIDVPTRTNYDFQGYYSETNGQGKKYIEKDGKGQGNWDSNSIKVLYAYWTVKPSDVKLNPNGGSGVEYTVKASNGSAMPASPNGFITPTKNGYVFDGYSEQRDDGMIFYNSEMQSVNKWNKFDTSWVLYAIWKSGTTKVTLNPNGGDGGTLSVNATVDQKMPEEGVTAPSRAGFEFTGYWTNRDGTGDMYYDSDMKSKQIFRVDSPTELFAGWSDKRFVVTLDLNAEDAKAGGDMTITVYDGQTISSDGLRIPTRDYYRFDGYFSDPISDNIMYYDYHMDGQGTWSGDTDFTIYAHWTRTEFQITLDANEGKFYGDSDIMTIPIVDGSFDPTAMDAPERNGYDFQGFYDQIIGGTNYIDRYMTLTGDGQNKDWNDNIKLYAHWDAKLIKITFDLAGGTIDDDLMKALNMAIRFNESFDLSGFAIPLKTDFVFDGFFDEDGKQYISPKLDSVSVWDKSQDSTLIAHWKPFTIDIPFDLTLIILGAALIGAILVSIAIMIIVKRKNSGGRGGRNGGGRNRGMTSGGGRY